MKASICADDGRRFEVDLASPRDLSLPVAFGAGGVEAFHLPPARREPVVAGGFVGATRQGGSCNCEELTLVPHGNGTHTEGPGHLLDDEIAVTDLLLEPLLLALLVTVDPEPLAASGDEVWGASRGDDLVVSSRALRRALAAAPRLPARALVVRTTGAAGDKRRRRYSGTNPPYLTVDAARLVRESGFDHLLVDLPSLDREDDGGELGAHRAFFDLPRRARSVSGAIGRRTATELIVVDDVVADGAYALSLQLPPIPVDAVPSRPLLFPLQEIP